MNHMNIARNKSDTPIADEATDIDEARLLAFYEGPLYALRYEVYNVGLERNAHLTTLGTKIHKLKKNLGIK